MWSYFIEYCAQFFKDLGQQMPPIFLVAIVGIIIQLVKVTIDSLVERKFSFDHVFSSGGFPSFHTGVASSITVIALLHDGAFSITFAIAATFSLLFAYDAMNIRFQTGMHAEYLNDIRKNLQDNLLMKKQKKSKLQERLGHTPTEVFWGIIFWVVLSFVLYYALYV